jgi:hypothetical protein
MPRSVKCVLTVRFLTKLLPVRSLSFSFETEHLLIQFIEEHFAAGPHTSFSFLFVLLRLPQFCRALYG